MGDSHTIALVAKPTSRIPFVTSEWREHFKMLGCTRGESPCRDSCFVNKQVCILKLFLELKIPYLPKYHTMLIGYRLVVVLP